MSTINGKEHLTNVARDVALQTNHVTLTVDKLSERIRSDLDLPDPELIIRVGKTPCLFSFLPWQMRLSEIFFVPERSGQHQDEQTLCRTSCNDILNVIESWSHVEKRFGK